MPSTTHPEFNAATEGLEVARAFSSAIRGKTAMVTGVNIKGIGFSTAEALVSPAGPSSTLFCGKCHPG